MVILPEEVKKGLLAKWNEKKNYTACVKYLKDVHGIDKVRSTVKRWIEDLTREEIYKQEHGDAGVVEWDKDLTKARAEASHYKKLYDALVEDKTLQDKVEEWTKTHLSPLKPIKVRRYLDPKEPTSIQAVVAPLTDTHIGEKISNEQMGNIGQYDFDIFNKRLFGWSHQVITLTNLRRRYAPIKKIYVPLLGDMISGDIHLELTRSNQDTVMGQMIRGARLISQALIVIAGEFEEVIVPCVVGNHGRILEQKPYSKDKYVNWDYMLYQWLAVFCRDQKNIRFEIPKTFWHIIDVVGKKILLFHGDVMRGKALSAQVTSMRDVLRTTGVQFDAAFTGDKHHVEEIDIGTGPGFICGSVKSNDEYALTNGLASQTLLIATYWHPIYGYIGRDNVYLTQYDSRVEKFEDNLPEVWIR